MGKQVANKAQKLQASKTQPVSEGQVENYCLAGGGEIGALMRGFNWDATAVGPVVNWPVSLRIAVSLVINSAFPMFIWWNKDTLTNFYNDAYRVIIGDKHPKALGRPAFEVWPEIWDDISGFVTTVFDEGKSVYRQNHRLIINRFGHDEETYFTFSYSPIRDESGTVAGLMCAVTETTAEVLGRQKLQESEERFRHLADTAPMYIAMADESGNAVYFNKPWLEFTGKKLDEMKGLGWLSVLHPDDAPKFEADFKHAFSQHISISKEYRFRRASDGEYRWMLAVGAPRFTPDGHFIGYFGTYTDFHELKEAQLAVQQSEERFRTLIEKSGDAVQLVSPTGEILFSSDSLVNVLGYTPEEIAHTGVTPYVHPEDKDYFFDQFSRLIQNPHRQILMQYRVKHKDGSWAWLETVGANHLETPNINALVGNFRNITRQKQAEEKLRTSEERFRALADNIPNLAWMAKADGTIFWYNNRWYDYTGTTWKQMEKLGWLSFHEPEYLPKVTKQWKQSISNSTAFEIVSPLKGADGAYRPFLTRIVPLMSEKGNVGQWIGTSTDISEQMKVKQAQARTEELEEITAQLDVQKKELIALNHAKDEFISLASHQLRTPATGVKQYIGMMLEGYAGELKSEQEEFARRAYESNEREIAIINDLLKVAQVDAGRMHIRKQAVDFAVLIQGIVDEQAGKFAERNQTVTIRSPAGDLTAKADKERMRMVLENLVDNASKYTPHSKHITISLKKLKKTLQIRIQDEGVGIGVGDREKIFDKFVRVDNPLSDEMGGSGIGLYLAKKIVGLHNGDITVMSKPGQGSVFTITIPR